MNNPEFPNIQIRAEKTAFGYGYYQTILLACTIAFLVAGLISRQWGETGADFANIIFFMASIAAIGTYVLNRKRRGAIVKAYEELDAPISKENAVRLSKFLIGNPQYKSLVQSFLKESKKTDIAMLSTSEVRVLRRRLKEYDEELTIKEAQSAISESK